MENNINEQMQENAKVGVEASKDLNAEYTEQNCSEKLSMNYVLLQIEKIALQTEHLNNAIQKLGQMANAEGPGDLVGQSKAQALGDVVRCRETTNQQLLKLYEKMYDDLKPTKPIVSDDVAKFQQLLDTLSEFPPNYASAVLRKVLKRGI